MRVLSPLLTLLLVWLMPLFSQAQDPAKRLLSAEQVRKDVALAKEAYERVHPGYTRYATQPELDQAWTAITQQADSQGGLSVGDLYLQVQTALVTIRCDHTKAELPQALRESRKTGSVYLPFLWQVIEGRGFVSSASEDLALAYGDEILSIDGRTLADTIAAVEGFIPVDGYTHWARRGGISQSLEFMGGAVDHFGALLWDVPAVAKLTVRGADGDLRQVEVQRVGHTAWTQLLASSGAARDFKDAITFERVGDKAAYLRVDTFVNYRNPVKPGKIYDPVFKALRKEGRDTLILDLRNNGGGSSDASQGLVKRLIPQKMQFKTDMRVATLDLDGLREHLWTWDKRALNPNPLGFKKNEDGTYSLRSLLTDEMDTLKPHRFAFQGRLIILTSTNNSSGSTNLISVLKDLPNTTLVGERTGGNPEGPTAGVLFTLTLPESGIKTRLPFFRYTNNVTNVEPGMGVTPDVLAPMTVAAFLAQQDPAYDAALEIAGK